MSWRWSWTPEEGEGGREGELYRAPCACLGEVKQRASAPGLDLPSLSQLCFFLVPTQSFNHHG